MSLSLGRHPPGPFSAGDSGSIILDRIGLAHRRWRHDQRPYWWLEEQMKVFPGCYLLDVVA
jgi:hypothetical protein